VLAEVSDGLGRRLVRIAPALLLLAAAACKDATTATLDSAVYQVKGKVIQADGKPLTRGRVVFVPEAASGAQALGEIGTDGSFSLKTSATDDGAVPGAYKVRIEPAAEDYQKGLKKLTYAFKYTDEDSSGLVVTIKPEPNQVELRLR
jgi:hypothetical protein